MSGSPGPLAGRRVLVVEDEYLIASEVKRWLQTTAGASAALQAREKAKLAAQSRAEMAETFVAELTVHASDVIAEIAAQRTAC